MQAVGTKPKDSLNLSPLIERYFELDRRRQDPYDPQSYLYYRPFPDLPDDNTHVVVAVKFRWATDPDGTVHEEKFVKTAYFQTF